MSVYPSSWAASLASLSAASLPSIPTWAFTHLKCTVQFCVVRCSLFVLLGGRVWCGFLRSLL